MTSSRLVQYLRPFIAPMVGGLLLTALASLATVGYAGAVKLLVQAVSDRSVQGLAIALATALALNVLKNAAQYFGGYTLTSVGQQVVRKIRGDLFARIQYFSLPTFDRWRAGDILSRFSNDMLILVEGVSALPLFVSASLTLVAGLAFMIYLNWELTLVTMAVAPLVVWAVYTFSNLLRRATTVALNRIADLNSLLQESLESMRIIKAFTRERYEIARFEDRNSANFGASMKLAQISLTQTPVIDVAVMVGVLILAGFALFQVVAGTLTVTKFFMFFTVTTTVANPISQLSNYIGSLNKAHAASRRIFELMDLPVEGDDPDAVELTDVRGAVEFADVRFSYDGVRDVLKGISAKVAPGEIVALVGPSGSGKTTLVNLVPRFYEPTSGAVAVDGQDVLGVRLSSLRRAIAIVPQDPQLFSDSIEENIRYGRLDATRAQVEEAARLANAHEFITKLPDGYETMVGSRGMRLSGGERQRIAIARAILRDPRILILDEATSSLDAHSEALIGEALDHLLVGRTTFIIAHRLSTIRRATVILVLADGRIVEHGTHEELLRRGGLYASLYERQMLETAHVPAT
ncbi:MAG: ABC transporter ATP-binding protein [Candidatus Eremiobacteraeota bacterium]|nr:ABC transporter ATP-binding protein [Candidatus Eremiobacteraeota bacterium]MBV8367224.1 ABC transporter ATP-binding protein [Candidatus Eremiobacteraeota bacterium]